VGGDRVDLREDRVHAGDPTELDTAAERDSGKRPGLTTGERDLTQGVGLFRTGGARAPTPLMVAFIDDHRAEYGVEPICRVLPIAPST
jgi:hypothetical protein